MLAAAEGDLEKVEDLIKDGAAIDQCDARGHTAVWHAVDSRKAKVVTLLLQKSRDAPRPMPAGTRDD